MGKLDGSTPVFIASSELGSGSLNGPLLCSRGALRGLAAGHFMRLRNNGQSRKLAGTISARKSSCLNFQADFALMIKRGREESVSDPKRQQGNPWGLLKWPLALLGKLSTRIAAAALTAGLLGGSRMSDSHVFAAIIQKLHSTLHVAQFSGKVMLLLVLKVFARKWFPWIRACALAGYLPSTWQPARQGVLRLPWSAFGLMARRGSFLGSAMASLWTAEQMLRVVSPCQYRGMQYWQRILPIYAGYLHTLHYTRSLPLEARHEVWQRRHEKASKQVYEVIIDLGGFLTKTGQILGTASQMMPPCYIKAFSALMDKNPPVAFNKIKKVVEKELRKPIMQSFQSFDPNSIASASVAQVHVAYLWDGRKVAVKVQKGVQAIMCMDMRNMRRLSELSRKSALDEGMDLPTALRAYEEVVPDEFDFLLEVRTLKRCLGSIEEAGYSDRVSVPRVVEALCTKKLLVMEFLDGIKLLDVLVKGDAACGGVLTQHAGGIAGVFDVLYNVWGQMVLVDGLFHADPHPGNILLMRDGRVGLIDYGEAKQLPDRVRLALCRLVVAMASDDHEAVARRMMEMDDFMLAHNTKPLLVELAYSYFDTRNTWLSKINLFDYAHSPFVKNPIVKNSKDTFFIVRLVYLLRGMATSFGVSSSMAYAWDKYARKALERAGETD